MSREADSQAEANDPETSVRSAFRLILAKLGRRDHTEQELRRALLGKGFPEESIQSAIQQAMAEGLVDDRRLAGTLARTTARGGRRGPMRVIATLQRKGVARDVAQAATREAFSSPGDFEARTTDFTRRLLERARGATPKEKRLRVLRSLVSRGFEPDEARRLVRIAENALMTQNEDDDENADPEE